MRRSTLITLLREEGAFPQRWDSPEAARKAKRKYRKLQRLAKKQWIPLELLLLQRAHQRQWEALQHAEGQLTSYRDGSVTYAVEVVKAEKVKHAYMTHCWINGRWRRRQMKETHRVVTLRVIGVMWMGYGRPPFSPVLAPGEEIQAGFRSIPLPGKTWWTEPQPLESFVDKIIAYWTERASRPDSEPEGSCYKTLNRWLEWRGAHLGKCGEASL